MCNQEFMHEFIKRLVTAAKNPVQDVIGIVGLQVGLLMWVLLLKPDVVKVWLLLLRLLL
jgi:hypothetical protein